MLTRRFLLKTFIVTASLLTGLPRRLLARKYAIGLDKVKKLKETGGSVVLKIKEQEILFIRVNESTIRAYDPTCTHEECTVAYNQKEKKILCQCHGSKYDMDGQVLNGPAEKPLREIESTLNGNRIIISLD